MAEAENRWVQQIFEVASADGGVVRRKVASVEKFASQYILKQEVEKRGFHMVISGDQYVITCNAGEFQVVC